MFCAVLHRSLLLGTILASSAACGQTVAAHAEAASAAASSATDLAKELARALQEQSQLLAEVRADIARTPVDDPHRAQNQAQLAAIEKRIRDENRVLSRRRYVSSAMQHDPVFGGYFAAMRQRIEDRGTADFPTAGGHKLYGLVTANLTVDSTGHIVAKEIVRGSGNPTLDKQALAIADAAAPFGSFTQAMRDQADQIVYTAAFNFKRIPDHPPATAASAP